MHRAFTRAAAAGVTAALAIPAVAGAHPAGHRSYANTFPIASALCAKVAAGHTPSVSPGMRRRSPPPATSSNVLHQ